MAEMIGMPSISEYLAANRRIREAERKEREDNLKQKLDSYFLDNGYSVRYMLNEPALSDKFDGIWACLTAAKEAALGGKENMAGDLERFPICLDRKML